MAAKVTELHFTGDTGIIMQGHWILYFDNIRYITEKAGGVTLSLKMKLEKL